MTSRVPELLVVADEHDLFGVVARDGNETLGLETHSALVDDQLVDANTAIKVTR